MKLAYTGFNASGQPVNGTIEAADAACAQEALRRQGVYTTAIEIEETRSPRTRGRAVSLKDLSSFARQLAILISTHTPLVQSLEVVERQAQPGPWRDTLSDLRRRVEEGASLSEAMAAHPGWFDAICRSMVAAGESGGMLDAMLKDLSSLLRRQLSVRKTVMGAMSYPIILIGVSVVVVTVMLTFVLPQFRELFESLQAPLPPTTKVLMAVGLWLREYWWAFVPALGLSIAGLCWWLKTPGAKAAAGAALLRAPKVGPILRGFSTARIARLLGVLLQARIPLLDALRLTREACGVGAYANLLERAELAVTRGQGLAAVLHEPTLVAPAVSEALASGERTGHVGEVLVQVAEYLDEDNDHVIKSLASIIEPLVLTVLGLVVGVVAVSMFMPLFDLTAAGAGAGGGGSP